MTDLTVKKLILLGQTLFWLIWFKTILLFGGYKAALRSISRSKPKKTFGESPRKSSEILWAIKGLSRRLPYSTCLDEALVAQHLLKQNGISCQIHIGVKKDTQFRAHAWVSIDDEIALGHIEDLKAYEVLAVHPL